ncbi:hypothetical protein [Sporolactobacillus pectinivorans]|uniref:hypothetical protein n=1 Tax=Sporolactobacillus pectinivorans TaxID=1591408 RepID=UPI000C25A17B|nr:hypothetical protein [Sporolactobacillus pectinivorans]
MIEILSIFEHSLFVEMALASLKSIGMDQKSLMALSLNLPPRSKRHTSTPISYDGYSRTDLGFIFATAFGVVGASAGFRLYWGPIIWGIASSLSGFLIGFLIEYFVLRHKKQRSLAPKVIMIIRCRRDQQQQIEQILWENQALGLTIIES